MAESIDESLVRRIAHLARLRVDDSEVRLFTAQLARILEYVKLLDSVDTSGVEPLAHPLPLSDVLRSDEIRPSLPVEQALANAPQRQGSLFKVPAVLDSGA